VNRRGRRRPRCHALGEGLRPEALRPRLSRGCAFFLCGRTVGAARCSCGKNPAYASAGEQASLRRLARVHHIDEAHSLHRSQPRRVLLIAVGGLGGLPFAAVDEFERDGARQIPSLRARRRSLHLVTGAHHPVADPGFRGRPRCALRTERMPRTGRYTRRRTRDAHRHGCIFPVAPRQLASRYGTPASLGPPPFRPSVLRDFIYRRVAARLKRAQR
jgi:hypothetical protein